MSENEVPFYTQMAILDRYVHSSDPLADPDVLEVILTVLRTKPDLRRYFFRSGPSAAWAPILWEQGFFDKPPSPEKTESGYVLPRWDVQEYLIDVAAEVPEIVVKVAEAIEGEGWYISQAIRALCYIPGEQADRLVPKIIEWLDAPQVSRSIAREVASLVVHLAQSERLDATLDLLHALTAPMPPSDLKVVGEIVLGAEATTKFPSVRGAEEFFEQHLPQMAKLHPRQVVAILQEHFCTAIRLEAESRGSPDFETWSWWRTAIEDTSQDMDTDYRDLLLRVLRDNLEMWVQKDAPAVESLIRQYLRDQRGILRRLGLHILHNFPTTYPALITDELQKFENLDDTGIHHEFFMLLRRGFSILDASDRRAVIAAICDGPPPARVKKLAEWAKEQHGADVEEYSRRHIQFWIRDRLWMLKDDLSGEAAGTLDRLAKEFGPPEHPAFTRWSSGGFWVRDVAPLPEQELAQMSPEELVRYAQEWRPDVQQSFGPERTTYRGLADLVAKVILAAPQRYAEELAQVILFRPEFPYALLNRAREEKSATSEAWEFVIRLCEILLEDQTVRSDISRMFEVSWVDVRRAVVHLLQLGLNNEQHRIPDRLLPRVRDILLVLLDDPDPDAETDRPPEGWFGHEDPAAVAINAVRSSALLALVEYAWLRARVAEETLQEPHSEGPGPKRLEPVVREALTGKLDRRKDPSWALHSVYGHYLPRLFWLDQEWVETHIDLILPEGEDEDSLRYYVAAWDSYVIFNHFWSPILKLLRPRYARAICNLGRGLVTRTHLDPGRKLAIHVASEYLRSDYDLRLPAGPQNLITLFFHQAPPQARGDVPWFFWRVLEENLTNLDTYWPKVRAIWEWRAKEASAASHSTDFDNEMERFAHLLLVAPEHETISSLWPLLEALLPHITRSERRGGGWRIVEEYLAAEVDRDPVRTIQFYRLMHDSTVRKPWHYTREEPRKIIGKAADEEDARHDALSLIDLLARHDIHQFRDIYDRYAG